MTAVNSVWLEPEGHSARFFSELKFLPHPHEYWIESTVYATQLTTHQRVHYHPLEGHLLVEGKPLGHFPTEYRKQVVLQELFGNQNMMTYPSALPGMTYSLLIRPYGHQIHLGFCNGKIIVRACTRDTVLELIPRELFISPSHWDLPASLIENCIHWLDLKTGFVEIRRQPNVWKSMQSNWYLNIYNRKANRRTSFLVDPQSPLFQRVARLFDRFEYAKYVTAYQPERSSLSVELRRLELSFWVNTKNLLQSSQLRC